MPCFVFKKEIIGLCVLLLVSCRAEDPKALAKECYDAMAMLTQATDAKQQEELEKQLAAIGTKVSNLSESGHGIYMQELARLPQVPKVFAKRASELMDALILPENKPKQEELLNKLAAIEQEVLKLSDTDQLIYIEESARLAEEGLQELLQSQY